MRHERALPIVAGCKALVLRTPTVHKFWLSVVGTEVIVVNHTHLRGQAGWAIDSDLVRLKLKELNARNSGFVATGLMWPERYLLRIDGDTDHDESITERKPNEVGV